MLALGLAGCASSSVPAAAPAAPLKPCRVANVAETAQCGTVRVRESADSSRTIDLRVIIVPALTHAPRPDPIVPLAGGPGQGAAALAGGLSQRYAALRDQRDLVFIDQRGTGESNGLECAPPPTTADLMGRIFDLRRLATCRGQLARAADLTKYTTTAAADDYRHVFDQLGYQTVNLIGVSYGSRMALEITRRHPGRIRTMTLDGVVPTNFDFPTTGSVDADASLNALIDDCEADRDCAEAHPRFRRDVDTAFNRVSRQAVTATVRDPASGSIEQVPFKRSDLGYATRGLLYGNEAQSLPLWFQQAAAGNFDALAQAYVRRARTLDAQISYGLHLSVYCTEDVPFVNWTAALKAAEPARLGSFLLDQYRAACEGWPRSSLDSSFRQPVHSAVPSLLMTGRRDPVTPPRTAVEVARTLSRSKVVTWPYGGHGTDGLVSGECRTSIMQEFLRTADPAAVPINCVSAGRPRPFVLR
ncbi:MAG TPA: alpha/beta hydrolase [Vicinamibacterales bacterium]|nr:alpha/beta hydrolase [Vicinamibacterales bacterium]